jgi:hypothetical protein
MSRGTAQIISFALGDLRTATDSEASRTTAPSSLGPSPRVVDLSEGPEPPRSPNLAALPSDLWRHRLRKIECYAGVP